MPYRVLPLAGGGAVIGLGPSPNPQVFEEYDGSRMKLAANDPRRGKVLYLVDFYPIRFI